MAVRRRRGDTGSGRAGSLASPAETALADAIIWLRWRSLRWRRRQWPCCSAGSNRATDGADLGFEERLVQRRVAVDLEQAVSDDVCGHRASVLRHRLGDLLVEGGQAVQQI